MSDRFRVQIRHFLLPKEGSGPEECEDAVAFDAGALRFAVADGATEAFDARRWAARLTKEWVGAVRAPLTAREFGPWLKEQGGWLHASWEGRKLPWYAEEKRSAGSYAALVGLRLEASGRKMGWRAVALGDSCLVQRRGGEVVSAFPLDTHEAFTSTPPLVPSSESLRETALARLVEREGRAEPGDTFLLMTDALSAWYFEMSARRDPAADEFDSLLAASENVSLSELVRRERAAARMKDDDVAVVRIEVVSRQ
ncbi:MAG TPA: protein phosphatase 2C domain-containing protein [Pyrinomonadaceae bacterium]|nr:protein phosphatase 2C domain-containing protein [Pyrinomonadaceae bacterium]